MNSATHSGSISMPLGSVAPLALVLCLSVFFSPFPPKNTNRDTTHSKHNSQAPTVFALLKIQTGFCLKAYLPVTDIHCKSHSGKQHRCHTDTQNMHMHHSFVLCADCSGLW